MMLGSCAVDKLSTEVSHDIMMIEESHACSVGYISHMSNFYILFPAIAAELLSVLSFNHHCHPLLRFADGNLCGIESAVLHWHTVEIDVESVCQLADSHAHSSRTKIVASLDQSCHFGSAEEVLQSSLYRRVTFLHLAAACLKRCLRMLFGRACGSAYAVASCPSAKHEDDISRHGSLSTHIRGSYGSDYRSHF